MPKTKTEREAILSVQELSVGFCMYQDGWSRQELQVITDLSLNVMPGEIMAVAGSSGSGKSLLAHAVMGLLPENASTAGRITYRGEELDAGRQRKLRGREIALIPQSVSYLDPLMPVGKQVRGVRPKRKVAAAQKEVFCRLGLPEKTERLYPFQLSGGMARRVLISTAVVSDADLILADEPTPGLDLALAMEALRIFRELADAGKAIVLITHDIDLAVHVADRVAVFYAGTTVETADASDFLAGPGMLRHPYTKALWKALPQNGFEPMPGFQPFARDLPKGCLFGPRCPYKTKECKEKIPMREHAGGTVRCIHVT